MHLRVVLERIASSWPTPLADSASNLLCVPDESIYETASRTIEVVRVSVRWVCGVALAARVHDANPPSDRTGEVASSVAQLRTRGALSDGQWRVFARELLRPYGQEPSAHPVAALVELFHGRGKGRTTERLDALLSLRNTLAHVPPSSSAALRSMIETAEVDLSGWLIDLEAAVASHRLVLPLQAPEDAGVGQQCYLLMGPTLRGGRYRRVQLESSVRVPSGRAMLVDGSGRPILPLEPAVRILRPSPDEPEEVFFFDGSTKRGAARYISFPNAIEREDVNVWEELSRLSASPTPKSRHAAEDRPLPPSPFLGLEAFDASRADVFFGRDREILELAW